MRTCVGTTRLGRDNIFLRFARRVSQREQLNGRQVWNVKGRQVGIRGVMRVDGIIEVLEDQRHFVSVRLVKP